MAAPVTPSALLQGIVDSTDDAIVAEDLDGVVTLWNPGAERLFGYAPAEAIGRSSLLIVPANLRGDAEEVRARALDGERVEHRETVRTDRVGHAVAVSITVSPIRDSAGRIVGLSQILRDVTERHQLQQAGMHLAAVVQSSDDAIASKDLEGIVQSWNPAAERMFGYTAEEIVGHSILMIIPEDRWAEEDDVLGRIRQGLRVDHFETIRRRKDGTNIPISLTVSPIRDTQGKVIGASKMARDLTALSAYATTLEATVRERTAALETANTQLEAFAYSVSHDLRAPLRGMHGLAHALLEDYGPALDDRARDYAQRIVLEAGLLDQLILDLLTYSRLDRIEVSFEPIALGEIIESAQEILRQDIGTLGATFEVAPDLPLLRGNRAMLLQVVTNLVSNAIKFGGTQPVVRIWAEVDASKARVWVEDRGIGIARRHQERIFRVFERLHGAERYAGTGIGLAIVQKAVERLGGHVGVESEEGHGSRFWFELPRVEAA